MLKLSFFFLPKTYWFAWFPFPEEGLYTIGCTSELLVLNTVLKPARVSFEGSRKICPLVLTCSIIRHSVPWVPKDISKDGLVHVRYFENEPLAVESFSL